MPSEASRVVVVRGERSAGIVLEALKRLGPPTRLAGRPILIKVNLIAKKDWRSGAVTDPVVVEGLLAYLKPLGSELAVVESDATFTNARKAAEASGILSVCEAHETPFINLRTLKERRTIPLPDHEVLKEVTLPTLVLDSHVVSAAKMKTHTETTVTLGLKNMFGLLPTKFKAKYHLLGVEGVVVDVNTVKPPSLTVIDGFIAMEGRGPVHGTPLPLNLLLAGFDPVATDATAARIMGFNPHTIRHIKRAHEKKLGHIDDITILGPPLQTLRRRFKH